MKQINLCGETVTIADNSGKSRDLYVESITGDGKYYMCTQKEGGQRVQFLKSKFDKLFNTEKTPIQKPFYKGTNPSYRVMMVEGLTKGDPHRPR